MNLRFHFLQNALLKFSKENFFLYSTSSAPKVQN
jgi:hypothetical protein